MKGNAVEPGMKDQSRALLWHIVPISCKEEKGEIGNTMADTKTSEKEVIVVTQSAARKLYMHAKGACKTVQLLSRQCSLYGVNK